MPGPNQLTHALSLILNSLPFCSYSIMRGTNHAHTAAPHHPGAGHPQRAPSLPCILTQAGFPIHVHDVLGVASTNGPIVSIITRVLAAPIAVVTGHCRRKTHITRAATLPAGSFELPGLTGTDPLTNTRPWERLPRLSDQSRIVGV